MHDGHLFALHLVFPLTEPLGVHVLPHGFLLLLLLHLLSLIEGLHESVVSHVFAIALLDVELSESVGSGGACSRDFLDQGSLFHEVFWGVLCQDRVWVSSVHVGHSLVEEGTSEFELVVHHWGPELLVSCRAVSLGHDIDV